MHIHDTFVTTLKVAFFSSVSEDVTVTRRSSGLGVDGLKQTASKKIYFEHLNLFHRKKDNNKNNNISTCKFLCLRCWMFACVFWATNFGMGSKVTNPFHMYIKKKEFRLHRDKTRSISVLQDKNNFWLWYYNPFKTQLDLYCAGTNYQTPKSGKIMGHLGIIISCFCLFKDLFLPIWPTNKANNGDEYKHCFLSLL